MIASGSSAYASIVNYGSDLKNLESFQKFIFEQKKYLPLSSELFKEKGIPSEIPSDIRGEVLIATKEFSRFGRLEDDQVMGFVSQVKKLGLFPIFVWDILQTENEFQQRCKLFEKLPLSEFSEIRVQDPGVLQFIKTKYPWLKIQLVLETGNHNQLGILTWINYCGSSLSRLVLSLELPKNKLSEILREIQKLPVAKNVRIELMVYGPILLFYTPRNLLKPLMQTEVENTLLKKSDEGVFDDGSSCSNRAGSIAGAFTVRQEKSAQNHCRPAYRSILRY